MTASEVNYPSTAKALIRGVLGKCPRCGQGRLLHHYLKMVEHCDACGEPYGHFRTDDAAPWLTLLRVGHMTIPIILVSELNFQLPLWTAYAIYLPLVVGLTAIMLPRCKGAIAAVMWVTKAEGSEKIRDQPGLASTAHDDKLAKGCRGSEWANYGK